MAASFAFGAYREICALLMLLFSVPLDFVCGLIRGLKRTKPSKAFDGFVRLLFVPQMNEERGGDDQ